MPTISIRVVMVGARVGIAWCVGMVGTGVPTLPMGGVEAALYVAVEGGIRPVRDALHQAVFDRVVVDVIQVLGVVVVVSDAMLPVTSLPDGALASASAASARRHIVRHPHCEARLDQPPSQRVVCIIGRQLPKAVQMVRQYDDGIDARGMIRQRGTKCIAQRIDVLDQRVPLPVGQIDREEVTAAGRPVPKICPHRMRVAGIALRFIPAYGGQGD